jgi:hypothetical protein
MVRAPDQSPPGQSFVAGKRRGGMHAVGAASTPIAAGLAGRRGWTAARLLADWSAIVGTELARRSMPERLVGQGSTIDRGRTKTKADGTKADASPPRRPAALRVRVGGAAALEIQHMEPQIIERVNSYFGYRAIDRLQLIQGPLPAPPSRRIPPPLDSVRARAIETKVASIGDPDLRASLARLGSAIARRQPR